MSLDRYRGQKASFKFFYTGQKHDSFHLWSFSCLKTPLPFTPVLTWKECKESNSSLPVIIPLFWKGKEETNSFNCASATTYYLFLRHISHFSPVCSVSMICSWPGLFLPEMKFLSHCYFLSCPLSPKQNYSFFIVSLTISSAENKGNMYAQNFIKVVGNTPDFSG